MNIEGMYVDKNHIKRGKKEENDEKHAKHYNKSTEHMKKIRRTHYFEGSKYSIHHILMGFLYSISYM